MDTAQYIVSGMTCGHCETAVNFGDKGMTRERMFLVSGF